MEEKLARGKTNGSLWHNCIKHTKFQIVEKKKIKGPRRNGNLICFQG